MGHDVPRDGASVEELRRWLGYIDDHIDYLASLAFAVYPRDSAEYHYARWTRVRLRFFVNVLRVKLGLRPQ
jgi:hypothetical protein